MEQHGINTQQFKIAATPEEAERAVRELGELAVWIDNCFLGLEENRTSDKHSHISRHFLVLFLSLSFFFSLLLRPPFPLLFSNTQKLLHKFCVNNFATISQRSVPKLPNIR